MKSNKKKVLLVAILLAVLVAIIFGYTYSKYAQKETATVTSAVAKWSFTGKVTNDGTSTSNSTVSLADTLDSKSITSERIAPGTDGKFYIVIDATGSEVDLSYSVSLVSETDKPGNLYFTYNGNNYSSLQDLISAENLSGEILESDTDKVKKYEISWAWPFETKVNGAASAEEDAEDLEDGENISNYEFSLDITGTQIQ